LIGTSRPVSFFFGSKMAAVGWAVEPAKRILVMKKPMRFLVCASATALQFGAAPIGAFIVPAQAQVGV
jgi:hypothetical protein